MKRPIRAFLGLLALAVIATPALAQGHRDPIPRLPDGRDQRDAILKAEHEKSLQDAAELLKLSEELKIELEKNDRHILSVGSIKKTEEIEKLARRIRSRLKRY